MSSEETKLIEVLMKIDGMKVAKEELKRWTSKCHYQRDLPNICGATPQKHLIYSDRSFDKIGVLVVAPCEKHLQAYLDGGWRIL